MSFETAEICEGVLRVRKVLGTGVLSADRAQDPLQQSAFLEVVVYVRDLMAKCERRKRRIDFTDDVDVTADCKDVSDLIRIVRDAACHIDSCKREIGDVKYRGAFNVFWGRAAGMRIGELTFSSAYDDDACVCYGIRRLYLKRHLIRAFEEAVAILSEDPDTGRMLTHLR